MSAELREAFGVREACFRFGTSAKAEASFMHSIRFARSRATRIVEGGWRGNEAIKSDNQQCRDLGREDAKWWSAIELRRFDRCFHRYSKKALNVAFSPLEKAVIFAADRTGWDC